MKRAFTITSMLLLSLYCFAQQYGHSPEENPITKKIQNEKIAYFTQEIGLTTEEAQVFWPVYFEYQKEYEEAHINTMKALFETTRLCKQPNADEAEIEKSLLTYNKALKNEASLQEKYYPKFKKVLPASKIAKLYLAEESFKNVLLNQFKAHRMGAAAPGAGGPMPQNFRYKSFVK